MTLEMDAGDNGSVEFDAEEDYLHIDLYSDDRIILRVTLDQEVMTPLIEAAEKVRDYGKTITRKQGENDPR